MVETDRSSCDAPPAAGDHEMARDIPIRRGGSDPFVLTEGEIQGLGSEGVVARGLEYARTGHVARVAHSGGALYARVQGSARSPYHVTVFAPEAGLHSTCSCPYDREPFCKHAIAALAAWSEQAGARDEVDGDGPSPAARLAALHAEIAGSEAWSGLLDLHPATIAPRPAADC